MTILVLGGNGKTGRRVAARLRALGEPVRIGSRAGDPPFDWERPETWAATLTGVRTVYVTYQPDLAFPGAAETIGEYARLAAATGVRRLVLLSGRGEEGARASERAVAAAGVEWAVVRSAIFMQNLSEDFLAEAVADGVLALPAGDVPEPLIDVEDIADVAVAALLGRVPLDRVYEVTGPRALTFAEVAATITAAGHPVVYRPVTAAEFAAGSGFPPEVAVPLGELLASVMDGRNVAVTSGVADALGRPPRDFAEFAKEVWS